MTGSNCNSIANVEERVGVADDYLKQELFVGRRKKRLGDTVGISQFGVNHTVLEPGAQSALRHWHAGEDEFIYVLSGQLTLADDSGERTLEPGTFCGFPAGVENAHHILNQGSEPASFLEIGSRRPGHDTVHYPDDDFGPFDR